MRFTGQSDYQHGAQSRRGILLINLGTPDAPTPRAVRRYLRVFLSDPRVVEIPKLLWRALLELVILPFRSRTSAKRYQTIWTKEGSPLLTITRQQGEALQQALDKDYGKDHIRVQIAMRYGQPSIAQALQTFVKHNVHDLTILPLYPQYCAATTGSTFDAVSQALSRYRWLPHVTFINGYHQNTAYIKALSDSIKLHIAQHGRPDRLLLSYHGIPQRCLQQGDPYFCFCQQTSRLVQKQLSLSPDKVMTVFQSRFGKAAWLQPYADKTLQSLAQQGHRHVAIICPGFAADCLETLEEIAVENRAIFLAAGGKTYHYIPCLNASKAHITALHDCIKQGNKGS